ncbi:hypothetical protein GGR58DRAFT_385720 [Xylaria digitata]|nr:hypothetical protein GGR58DRAFT_385720 [Xylaria digitata]
MEDSAFLASRPSMDYVPREAVASNGVVIRPNRSYTQMYPYTHGGSRTSSSYSDFSTDNSPPTASISAQSVTAPATYQARLPDSPVAERPNPEHPALWTSSWLHRTTLLGFTALFTGLWIALILLWRYNAQMNGFALNLSSNPYTWTYGPTVILTILVGLWRQVDYHCKLVQPWKAMQKRPEISTKSVLLDYISPFQIFSLWRALRNRHWAVILTITGFALLKAIIVVSTAFLVAAPTSLLGNFSITINNKFDGSDFLRGLTGFGGPAGYIEDGDHVTEAYRNLSSAPVYTVIGTLKDELQPAPQILNGTVVQTFDVAQDKTNITTVAGLVEVFTPNITCETAFASLTPTGRAIYDPLDLKLNSETCSIGKEKRPTTIQQCSDDGPCQRYSMLRVNCSEDGSDVSREHPTIIGSGRVYDLRFALVSANLSTENGLALTEGDSSAIIATAAICKVDYNIRNMSLAKSLRDNGLSLDPTQNPGESTHLPNLSGLKLGELIYSMLVGVAVQDGFDTFSKFNTDSIFNLMTLTLDGSDQNLEAFFDVETMKSSFIEVFSQLACHLMQSNFLVPDSLMSEGQGVYDENRLFVQALSAQLMIIGTIILSIMALIISFIAPRGTTPQDPALLTTHGAILARSSSIERTLLSLGGSRQSQLRRRFRGVSFQSVLTNNGSFRITSAKSPEGSLQTYDPIPSDLSDEESHSPVKRGEWIPLFARYPIVILIFALPITAIVGLEILYQLSEKNRGLSDVKNTPPYYVRYPSSLAALAIATLFNSLDFTLSSYAHFHALRSGPTSARRGIMTNLIQMMPPAAWYRALKNRYFGALSSITAAIIGSLLTVVVSGLWGVDPNVVVSTTVSASVGTTWDVSWKNSSYGDGDAAFRLKAILTNSSTNPDGIWDDLVLPDVSNLQLQGNEYFKSLLNMSSPELRSTWNFSMQVPALRPQLRCEPVTKTTKVAFGEHNVSSIDALYPLPQHCHGGSQGNLSYGRMTCRATALPWFGCVQDLHMGPWNASNLFFSDSGDSGGGQDAQPDNPDGCPSIGIMFMTTNQTSQAENATALFCYQEIQEVETYLSFWYDASNTDSPFTFGPSNIRSSPVVNESTATPLTNGTSGIESFHYRIERNFGQPIWDWKPDTTSYYLSPILSTILYGPDSIPPEDLLGASNLQRLQDAVSGLYNKYMVQVINSSIFRKPLDTSSGQPRQLTGTVTTTVSRLKVNFISKLVLQILLATMVVLGGLGFWMTDVRGTLPRDPYSIASSMALFAGSEFCSRARLTPRAEWMRADEMKELLGDQRFSLGWWKLQEQETDGEQSERFGIDFGTAIHKGFSRK